MRRPSFNHALIGGGILTWLVGAWSLAILPGQRTTIDGEVAFYEPQVNDRGDEYLVLVLRDAQGLVRHGNARVTRGAFPLNLLAPMKARVLAVVTTRGTLDYASGTLVGLVVDGKAVIPPFSIIGAASPTLGLRLAPIGFALLLTGLVRSLRPARFDKARRDERPGIRLFARRG